MSGPDFVGLLYLNPELTAYSNYITVADVSNAYYADPSGPLSNLPYEVNTPAGFDPRVFLASQSNVSDLNETIGIAMIKQGLSSNAVERRGIYVSTLTRDVTLSAWDPATKQAAFMSSTLEFNSNDVQIGDYVSLQRKDRGDSLQMKITNVLQYSIEGIVLYSVIQDGVLYNTKYTVSGIRVFDAGRQSRVVYARTEISNVDDMDIIPKADFSANVYQKLYPGTRTLNSTDAYIDYRWRWKRADDKEDYRISRGGDVFNLEAPYYDSNALGNPFPPYTSNFVDTYGYVLFAPDAMTVGCNLILAQGYSQVKLGDNSLFFSGLSQLVDIASNQFIIDVDGNINIGKDNSNLNINHALKTVKLGHTMVNINNQVSNMSFGMPEMMTINCLDSLVTATAEDMVVNGRLGVGMKCDGDEHSNVDDTGTVHSNSTRLAVDGDIYTTGTVVTLSDCNQKYDISLISNAMERMQDIHGYTWTRENGARGAGVLAQEVEKSLPQAVRKTSTAIKGVAYGDLLGLVIEATHSLNNRITQLEEQLLSKS